MSCRASTTSKKGATTVFAALGFELDGQGYCISIDYFLNNLAASGCVCV